MRALVLALVPEETPKTVVCSCHPHRRWPYFSVFRLHSEITNGTYWGFQIIIITISFTIIDILIWRVRVECIKAQQCARLSFEFPDPKNAAKSFQRSIIRFHLEGFYNQVRWGWNWGRNGFLDWRSIVAQHYTIFLCYLKYQRSSSCCVWHRGTAIAPLLENLLWMVGCRPGRDD